MRFRTAPTSPLFNFTFTDFEQIHEHSDALLAILQKRLDGIIVRNVLSSETVLTVVERLEQNLVEKRKFHMFQELENAPYTVGQALVGTNADLVDYFNDAALQRARIEKLFAGVQSYENRISEVLTALSGNLPVKVAHTPDGISFTPSTVRVLTEDHEIGVHVGNEFARLPQARLLHDLIDMTDQISFFIPLSIPDAGGELLVYGVEWSDVNFLIPQVLSAEQNNAWLEGTEVFKVFEAMDSTAFAPEPGDMLVFDGGRYFHRVSKTIGKKPRRTIGGFAGFSSRHDTVYYWS